MTPQRHVATKAAMEREIDEATARLVRDWERDPWGYDHHPPQPERWRWWPVVALIAALVVWTALLALAIWAGAQLREGGRWSPR